MLPAGYAAAYKKQMLQPSTATSVFYFSIVRISDQIIRFELLERTLAFLLQLLKLRDLTFELRAVGSDFLRFRL